MLGYATKVNYPSIKTRRLVHLTACVFVLIVAGCRSTKRADNHLIPPPPSAPPINTIKIGNFQCGNAIIAQAVHNVFIEVISRNQFVKIIQDGEADIVLNGTVTSAYAGSSMSSLGAAGNWAAGKSSSVVGEYISGITVVATRNGEILTSSSYAQVISKGEKLLPPEYVAREAARRIVDELYRNGLRRR